jgi:hypothetical protein
MFTHRFAKAIGRITSKLLFFLLISCYGLHAQQWSFQTGVNVTTYDFKNTAGNALAGIKAGSGNLHAVQYRHKLADTAAILVSSSPWAIYLNQNPLLAKVLGKFQWGLGIQFNQFNAVGDAVNTAYSYQTDYLGISPSLQFSQKLYKHLSIQASGLCQINQLVHGNQWVNNRFIDLKNDPQFKNTQILTGFQVGLQQVISEGILISISYQQASSLQAMESQGTSLVLRPNSLIFGLVFQPKRK